MYRVKRILAASLVLSAFAASSQAVVINEFLASHTGTDTYEFIEIFGDANTDYSNLGIVIIEGDGAGAGTLDRYLQLGTTDANGFWWSGFLADYVENGTETFFLVSGYSGTLGTDLDSNNDGILDLTPWASILDEVAIKDTGTSDFTYSSFVLGPDGTNLPAGASRIPNGIDTDTPGDWMFNDFNLAGIPGYTNSPASGYVWNTPGTVNAVPEPATIAALGLGVAALIRRRRR